ncbi:MAG: hypothetical protein V4560_08690 [Bacteroidota bacterium]
MENLTPSQKLDKVLFVLAENNSKISSIVTLASLREYFKASILPSEIPLILAKLEKDGFIKCDLTAYSEEVYSISFEGLAMNEVGYHNQSIISSQNETRIVRNERLLVNGTWAAAIAALLVLLWQIFLFYFPHYSDYPYHWIWETIPKGKP